MSKFNKGGLRAKLCATDWLSGLVYGGDFDIVQVQFKNTRNDFYRNTTGQRLNIGDIVAVEASPGHDIGRVMMTGPLVRLQIKKSGVTLPNPEEMKRVFRIARQADLEKFEEAKAREHETMIRSRQIAAELQLNMKIGDVEYQGDGGKAIFYYIADERVDFRKLIRILADSFKVRIEMRQIGARQEAGRIGGIGPCGRPLCCSSWMGKFISVGTGAARLQDLSMNPQKLAGQCAKLKCCLNFETDIYAEAAKQLPPKDVTLETKDATYFYFKPDILARKITYSTDKSIPANLVTIDASRAFEIIALNKQGVKVDALAPDSEEEARPKEYIDLTDQDSLTRFDKSKRRKKKKASAKTQGGEGQRKQAHGQQPGLTQGKPQGDERKQKPQQKQQQPKSQPQGDERRQERQQKQRQQHQRPEQRQEQKTEQRPGQKTEQRQEQRNRQRSRNRKPAQNGERTAAAAASQKPES